MKSKITTFIRKPKTDEIVKVYIDKKRHYFGVIEKIVVGKTKNGDLREKVVLKKIDAVPTIHHVDYFLDQYCVEVRPI